MARGRSDSQEGDSSKSEPLDHTEVFGPVRVQVGSDLLTPTPDAFTGMVQDPSTYFTTWQVGKALKMAPGQVHRWCRQWFGQLPPARQTGKGMGYRIPKEYMRVARGWKQSQDPKLREALREAIVKQPGRDYVVVVGNQGTTHYTYPEAMARLDSVLPRLPRQEHVVSVIYVGPTNRKR
jgi:hypothetical protein